VFAESTPVGWNAGRSLCWVVMVIGFLTMLISSAALGLPGAVSASIEP